MIYKVLNESGVLFTGIPGITEMGQVVERDPEDEQVIRLLDGGFIEAIPDEEPRVASSVVDSQIEHSEPTEPRLRYRGQLVLSESERTVGKQTFRHIHIADGSEYDLTDLEYKTEVKMAYPPVK